MPKQPRHEAIGIELLEIFQPLAAADKRNRHADDRHDRQRRAAARIAVELAQDDAADAEPAVELARALDGVLPCHRVGDVQQIRGLRRVANRLELGHQLVVDVQAACRVDDDDVVAEVRGFGDRALRARDGIHLPRRIVHADAETRLLRDDVQLLNRRRPLHVGRHEQCVLALLGQPLRELARGRRLARALQAQQQDHARPLVRRLQSAFGIAEERDHFVADDLDDLLRRRQAPEHILPQRAIAHAVDERLDDLEIDVGFEQREANLAERRLHVLGSQPCLAPKGLENVL